MKPQVDNAPPITDQDLNLLSYKIEKIIRDGTPAWMLENGITIELLNTMNKAHIATIAAWQEDGMNYDGALRSALNNAFMLGWEARKEFS